MEFTFISSSAVVPSLLFESVDNIPRSVFVTKHTILKESIHRTTTKPSKATRETSKYLVALRVPPCKGTALFPPIPTPVALGAAEPDAPVVPGTKKGPVVVGYGGTRLLTVPTAAEEVLAEVKPGVVGEG